MLLVLVRYSGSCPTSESGETERGEAKRHSEKKTKKNELLEKIGNPEKFRELRAEIRLEN